MHEQFAVSAGSLASQQAVTSNPTSDAPVAAATTKHGAMLNDVDAAVGELERRLHPVLRPLTDPIGEKLTEVGRAISPLAEELSSLTDQVDALRSRLVRILDRLEL